MPAATPEPAQWVAPPTPRTSGCAPLLIVGLIAVIVLVVLGNSLGPDKPSTANVDTAAASTSEATAAAAVAATEAPPTLPAAELMAKARDKSLPTSERLEQLRLISENYPKSSEANQATVLRPELEMQRNTELNPVGQQWSYAIQEDGMSGKFMRTASVSSTNGFHFDFPYEGRQQARLLIRRHPRWGNDVILSIERGQILCSSYGGCPIRVRFDDEPARTFKGNEPADNSSEMVFIPGYDNFARKLATAERVRIEFNVYQQGAVVADFDVSGFDRKRLTQ